jgi:hypothetical protein
LLVISASSDHSAVGSSVWQANPEAVVPALGRAFRSATARGSLGEVDTVEREILR